MATCANGTWVNAAADDVSITCYPSRGAPDVMYQVAQSTVTLSFSGGCSSQAADAAVNGLMADLQQQLAAAAVPNTTASLKRNACSNNQVRFWHLQGLSSHLFRVAKCFRLPQSFVKSTACGCRLSNCLWYHASKRRVGSCHGVHCKQVCA
jgi:hypothetical protein